MTTSDFWEQAACREIGIGLFFDDRAGRSSAPAKSVCARCPVRQPCLEFALATEDPDYQYGVFGGLTAKERRALHNKRTCRTCGEPIPVDGTHRLYCSDGCFKEARRRQARRAAA